MRQSHSPVYAEFFFLCSVLFITTLTIYYYSNTHYLKPKPISLSLKNLWGDSHKNYTILIHVTDIHLSISYRGKSRIIFHHFIENHLKNFYPNGIIVSGDIVDGKIRPPFGIGGTYSLQREEEWAVLKSTLYFGKIDNHIWLDVRGNHDTFGVEGYNKGNDFFIKYGKTGSDGIVYSKIVGNDVRIVGVNAAQMPGPHRPINFFGVVSEKLFDKVKKTLIDGCTDDRLTILFSHFPSSTLMFEGDRGGWEQLNHICDKIRKAKGLPRRPAFVAYLSGHLHSAGDKSGEGTLVNMPGNYVEMQMSDLRYSHAYRILVVDHNMLFWKTLRLSSTFPVVLVTNPAPGSAAISSTHIRMFLFRSKGGRNDISNQRRFVEITINGKSLGSVDSSGNEPLHVLPWNPSQYTTGEHILQVYVDDIPEAVETITFHIGSHERIPYPSNKPYHIWWLLSDFPSMAIALSRNIIILILTILILPKTSLPCIRPFTNLREIRQISWILLITFGITLLTLPLIISLRFYHPNRPGVASLLTFGPSVCAADTAIVVALAHILFIYLPLVYLTLESLTISNGRTSLAVMKIKRLLKWVAWLMIVYRLYVHVMRIIFAYGWFASLVSPSALPTVLIVCIIAFVNSEPIRIVPSKYGAR